MHVYTDLYASVTALPKFTDPQKGVQGVQGVQTCATQVRRRPRSAAFSAEPVPAPKLNPSLVSAEYDDDGNGEPDEAA